MKNIGFKGGGALYELGTVDDVVTFFYFLGYFTNKKFPKKDWCLLTDRLYRRYLKFEQADIAVLQMIAVKEIFLELDGRSIDWPSRDTHGSRLDVKKKNLYCIFEKYFDAFFYCCESAKVNYEGFKSYPGYEYEPVRVVESDMPGFIFDKIRPLEQYDALGADEKPFWLR